MAQPSVRKNYIYRMLYEILVLITPFITTPYVSRVLGADGIGIYSYTSSILYYFTLCAALGTAGYGMREIAQHRNEPEAASKLFWEIELLSLMTSGIAVLGWILVIAFYAEYRIYFIALIPMLLATAFDISWYFTGYEKIKYIVIRNTLCKLAGIALLFLFVRKKQDLILYVIINSVVQLLGNLSMWTYLPKMLVKTDFRDLHFRHHLHETLIYFIPTVATSIYTVLDKTLIHVITGSEFENGYYEQATKIINIVKTLAFSAVNAVMGARTAYLFAEKKFDEVHQRIERSLDFIMLIAVGGSCGVVGVAKVFVPVFFGTGYDEVVPLLYCMSPLVIIIGISNCLGNQYYTPVGKRAESAKYLIAGSVSNLILNLIMIPFFGAIGATAASVVAELLITILYVSHSDGYMTVHLIWKVMYKRLIAGLVMLVMVVLLGEVLPLQSIYVVAIQVVCGVACYGGLLLLLKDAMLKELLLMVWSKVKHFRR